MIWATTDRFPESPGKSQSFNTFSEYLRHQFLLSKNGYKNADILNDVSNQKLHRTISPDSVAANKGYFDSLLETHGVFAQAFDYLIDFL